METNQHYERENPEYWSKKDAKEYREEFNIAIEALKDILDTKFIDNSNAFRTSEEAILDYIRIKAKNTLIRLGEY